MTVRSSLENSRLEPSSKSTSTRTSAVAATAIGGRVAESPGGASRLARIVVRTATALGSLRSTAACPVACLRSQVVHCT